MCKIFIFVYKKVYGSENALKMHIKLKHPDFVNLVPVVMVNSHISSDFPHPTSHSSHPHPSHPSHHGPPHHPPSHHTLPHHVTPPPNHHMHHPSSYTYRQYNMTPGQGPSTPPPPSSSSSHMIARTSSYGPPPPSRGPPFGSFPPSSQCIRFFCLLSPFFFLSLSSLSSSLSYFCLACCIHFIFDGL